MGRVYLVPFVFIPSLCHCVRIERIELSWINPRDFKSLASSYCAISAKIMAELYFIKHVHLLATFRLLKLMLQSPYTVQLIVISNANLSMNEKTDENIL